MKRFIIDVGEFLNVTTPYSEKEFVYDDIDYAMEDLRYCIECEVKNNEKKNA